MAGDIRRWRLWRSLRATRTLIQYCGRLIRSENDVGRIVILDRRLIEKRYGTSILRALPPFRQLIER